ncbi:hypothetical protein ABNN70_06585 [Sporolactobacillus sp. Y61]|uniref:Uncharacterized protein n=1 Tax=Sporolactobacillus sp. Y61 TaxID=3160863 RepID=A0AAU8IJ30_9BACL
MHRNYVKMGEHVFAVHAGSAVLMVMVTKAFNCMKSEPHQPISMELFIHGGYGTPAVRKMQSGTSQPVATVIHQDDYTITIDADFRTAHLYAYNAHALTEAFYSLYSLCLIHNGWGVLLHAREQRISAGQAELIAGLSLESLPPDNRYTRSAADIVPVKITPRGCSFFSMSTQAQRPCSMPLNQLFISGTSFGNRKERLDETTALLHLIHQIYCLPNRTNEMKRAIDLLKQLVSSVPVYQVPIHSDEEWIS